MRRGCRILVSLTFVASVATSQELGDSSAYLRQQALLTSLLNVAEEQEFGWQIQLLEDQLRAIEAGQAMSGAKEQDIQREVETFLRPVPILNGALVPTLTQPRFPLYRELTADEQSSLLDRSRSVSRIEMEVAGNVVARGTAFVIGKDLLATNCHVAAAVSSPSADGRLRLGDNVRAHFADGPTHEPAHEFEILDVVGYPTTAGLDVAVLRVATTSLDNSTTLPKPLTIRQQPLEQIWRADTGFPIALIGYPVVTSSREPNYQELSLRGQFAKIYSPGAVIDLRTQEDVDLLLHVAGTTAGSSGSPLFAVDNFDVIGVHSCCTAAGSPLPASLPCSQILQAPPLRNVAVASSKFFSEPRLAPFFNPSAPDGGRND